MSRDALQHHNPRFASTSSPTDENFSQATVRTYAVFTDQFGREWGADVERKTMQPCGPLAPKFQAPMYPPRQYIHITDTMRMRCFVDLASWLRHLEERHRDYSDVVVREAQRLFTDKYHTAFERLPDGRVKPTNDALLHRVGGPPEPFEIVQAMQAKNLWMLGLKDAQGNSPKRPNHPLVDEWFPEPVEVRVKDPFTGEVIDDPFATDSGETEPVGDDPFAEGQKPGGGEAEKPEGDFEPHEAYPFMYAPGQWHLSEAHHRAQLAGNAKGFRGTGDEARAEIERMQELVAAGTGIHESWG